MNSVKSKNSLKETFTFISTIISWTIFSLLMICVILLLYYFVSTQLYARKGDKFEPKFSLYTIISGSMIPNIQVYDVIVNFRVDSPEDIELGDVITFVSESTESMGDTVTHRVVSIIKDEEGNYSYQTKGDNNLIEDSSSVPYSNVIGRVGLKIPQLGRVQFFVASSYGWLCLILLPALYIIFKDVLKIKNLLNKDGKFGKFLSTPLLTGKKKKLLPEPKNMDVAEVSVESPVEEIKTQQKEPNPRKFYDDLDDEFDLDDMPKLK